MEYLKQFQKHFSEGNFTSIVSLWHEYCHSDEVDAKELSKIFECFKKSPFSDSLGKYIEDILPLWAKLPDDKEKETILKLIIDIQTTNSKALANLAESYIQSHYANDPNFARIAKLIPIREHQKFQSALSQFDLLIHLRPGNFCFHTKGWGVGEVLSVSFLREEATFEFDYLAGPKEIPFQNALSTLIPLPKEHFLSCRFGHPDKLEALARENPCEVIRLLLRDLGPKTASDIKEEMCDLVIPENQWQKWWQTARGKLKKDPLIEVPQSLNDPFILRSSEVSHEDRLQQELLKGPTADTLIEMIYSFIRDFPGALKSVEFKEKLKQHLTDCLARQELNDGQELQLLFLLKDLSDDKENKSIAALVQKMEDPIQSIEAITVLSFKKRYLIELKEHRKGWDEVFMELFIKIDQIQLKEFTLSELIKANKKQIIEEGLKKLFFRPEDSPGTFIWYITSALVDPRLPFSDREGKLILFETLFTLLHRIENAPLFKDYVKKSLGLITGHRFQQIRNLFSTLSVEEIKEILLLSTKCHSLSHHDLKTLRSLAEVVHPSLTTFSDSKEQDTDTLWSSEEGYHKIRKRIEEVSNVELLETAKEIEVARSYGDLRENSEFKFALEKRDRLQAELRRLTQQLNRTRILTDDDVDASRIGIGTIFTIEFENGTSAEYRILGPADADADHNILSYQSKLFKELEGKKVGEGCEVNQKRGKISKIESIFRYL